MSYYSPQAKPVKKTKKPAGWGRAVRQARQREEAAARPQIVSVDSAFQAERKKQPKKKKHKKKPKEEVKVTARPQQSLSAMDTPSAVQQRNAVVLFTCAVQCFRHAGLNHVNALGRKQLILQLNPLQQTASLLIQSPHSTSRAEQGQQVLEIELEKNFEFALKPDCYGMLRHPLDGNIYSVLFATVDERSQFALKLVLAKHTTMVATAQSGGSQSVLSQDLRESSSNRLVEHGDIVKVKYSLFLVRNGRNVTDEHGTSASALFSVAPDLGVPIGSQAPKKFTVGAVDGSTNVQEGVQEGMLGMKKGAIRCVIIPPFLSQVPQVWGPHVPRDATVVALVDLTHHKKAKTKTVSLPHNHAIPPSQPKQKKQQVVELPPPKQPAPAAQPVEPVLIRTKQYAKKPKQQQQQQQQHEEEESIEEGDQQEEEARVDVRPRGGSVAALAAKLERTRNIVEQSHTPTKQKKKQLKPSANERLLRRVAKFGVGISGLGSPLPAEYDSSVEEDESVAVADAEDVEESEEARVRVLFGETSAAAEHTPKQHRKSKATATAAAARRSKKQQQQDELAALFQKMGLENYLEIFVSQEIQIHDLALLIDEEVEALIPKIGPRRRFMNGLALYLEEHAEADRPHTANLTSSPVKVLTRQKRVGSVDEQQLEDHAQAFSLLLTRLTKAPRRVINTEIERSYNAGFEACRAEAKLQIAGVKAAARKRLKNNETMHASAHSSDEHIIDTLKLRLARAEAKTVRVEDMSREYVAGVKSQAKDDRKATVLVLKDCMEELFSQTSLTFDDNDVLDGETVKGKLQNIMRRVTKKHAQAIMKKKR